MTNKDTDCLYWIAIWIIFLLTMALIIVSTARDCQAEPFHFEISNDLFLQTDRLLTSQADLRVGKFSLHNDMYSPEDKTSDQLPDGDLGWDGESYVEYTDIEKVAFGQEMIVRYRLGAVGEWSGSETLQKFVHNDLGKGVDPSWKGQNPSEPFADIIFSKRTREYVKSVIGDSALEGEYGVHAGTAKDSVFLRQTLTKHFQRYFNLHAGMQGEFVLYDTHLDGRLLQRNEYTVNKQPFVAEVKVGLEVYLPSRGDWFIDLSFVYQTERFEGQQGRHLYNTFRIGRKF